MNKRLAAAVAVLGLILLVTGIYLSCHGFPTIVYEQIKDKVAIRNGSEAYNRYRILPQPMHFKVYVFNVTNPVEVMNGERPVVQEVGPYYYDLIWEHVNIIDQPEDEALRAQLKKTFFFNKIKSAPYDEGDVVTVLNVALLGVALKFKSSPFALNAISSVTKEIFIGAESPFLTTTVGKLLFDGVVVINCNLANSSTATTICDILPSQLPRTIFEEDTGIFKLSMFHYKNTSQEWYTTKRGLTNSSDVGRTIEWRNKTSLNFWKSPYCNMINGTDSTIYPPFPSQNDKVYIFSEDVCRSVHALYERKVEIHGIPALHFSGYEKIFASGNTEEDNKCFCRKKCLGDGVIDLNKCHDAPIIGSLPHFYHASDSYKSYVIGLDAKKELHETFVELEEKAGHPVRGAKRVQLNMFMTRIPQLEAFRSVSQGLFPIMWVDEGVTLEGKSLLQLQNIYKKLDTLNTIKWIIIAVGLAALVGALFLYFSLFKETSNCSCKRKRHSNRVMDMSQKHHEETKIY